MLGIFKRKKPKEEEIQSNVNKRKEIKRQEILQEKALQKEMETSKKSTTVQLTPLDEIELSLSKNSEGNLIAGLGDEMSMGISIAPSIDTAAMTHIGTRAYQQDAFFVGSPMQQEENVAVLCDGMGGMDSGELASNAVIQYFANALGSIGECENLLQLLLDTTKGANDMMLENFRSQGMAAGTTMVCACVKDGGLYWTSVGDSRIYLIRGHEIARLTKDHNYALRLQMMVDNGELSQQEADSDPDREALVSYLGAPSLEWIDIPAQPFPLQNEDIVLLCSDGITKGLSDARILEILTQPNTLQELVHTLVISAVDAGILGSDNTTAVLMKYIR